MESSVRLPKKPAWLDDFRAFILRGNVVDLAVGIIIGAAFTAIVTSLVKDLVNPLLGLAVGRIDFSNLFITLKGPREATLAAAQQAHAVTLNVGLFINAVINFLIVAFAIFWLVRAVAKLYPQKPAVSAPPRSEVLLEEIRDLIKAQKS